MADRPEAVQGALEGVMHTAGVLSPELTARLLTMQNPAEYERAVRERGIVCGSMPAAQISNFGGTTTYGDHIETQFVVDGMTFNLTAAQEEAMTVKQFKNWCRSFRNLSLYSGGPH